MKIFLISMAMIISVLLILVIVLQEAKTAGMGAAVGGSSDSFFGGKARGKDAVLSKFTVIFGVLFAVICIGLGRYLNTF